MGDSYSITGIGTEPVSASAANLEEAARTASKMEDQGIKNVRVFDPSGAEVPQAEWEAAWWQWDARNRPSN
jgi:dihydrodipicolinate synthase/N-acetylneuraminate lyase